MKKYMKNNKTLKRIYNIGKPHIKTVILVSILAILIDLIEIAKPYLVKVIIDEFLSKGIFMKGFLAINTIGLFYIVIAVLGNVLDFITSMKTNIMGEEILYTMRNKLYNFTQNANITFHDRTPAGKLPEPLKAYSLALKPLQKPLLKISRKLSSTFPAIRIRFSDLTAESER